VSDHISKTASFGKNVRQLRLLKKLTQEELAEIADLDPTYISGIERGIRNPSLLSICRVANALKTSVSQLTEGI
jgi:transcriptional regulator with XRE-family HTH domain